MRRSVTTLNDIKQAILLLKGEQVKMYINRGRRKILRFDGVIDKVYNSVFTVKEQIELNTTHTYSYSDILCGDVKITKLAEEKN